MMRFAAAAVMLIATVLAIDLKAGPVLWTLSNVEFDDGGTASGTFMYDAITDTFSNYNIVTTAGSALGGAVYSDAYPFTPSDKAFIVVTTDASPAGGDVTGENVLYMVLASPMTNAGGTIMVLSDADGGFSFEATNVDNLGGNMI